MPHILTYSEWRSLSENAGDSPWRDLSDDTQYYPGSRLSKKIKFHGVEYEINAAQRLAKGEKHVRRFRRATLTMTATGGDKRHHERLLDAFHRDGWIHDGKGSDGSMMLKHPTRNHTAHVQQTGNKSRVIVFGGFNKDEPHNQVHGMMDTIEKTLTRKP